MSLLEIGPDLRQAARESKAGSDDGNEILQLEVREESESDGFRNEADGDAAEKQQSEVAEKQSPGDFGILRQTTHELPLENVQMKVKNENDILEENEDALSIRAEWVVLHITMDEGTHVNHVINDKGKIFCTLKVERVHIQTQHTAILQDGVDLREFHNG